MLQNKVEFFIKNAFLFIFTLLIEPPTYIYPYSTNLRDITKVSLTAVKAF